MYFNPLEDKIVHFLGSNCPLGGQLFDAGLKSVQVMKGMSTFDNLQIRVLRANGFYKFFRKRANLNQT